MIEIITVIITIIKLMVMMMMSVIGQGCSSVLDYT